MCYFCVIAGSFKTKWEYFHNSTLPKNMSSSSKIYKVSDLSLLDGCGKHSTANCYVDSISN